MTNILYLVIRRITRRFPLFRTLSIATKMILTPYSMSQHQSQSRFPWDHISCRGSSCRTRLARGVLRSLSRAFYCKHLSEQIEDREGRRKVETRDYRSDLSSQVACYRGTYRTEYSVSADNTYIQSQSSNRVTGNQPSFTRCAGHVFAYSQSSSVHISDFYTMLNMLTVILDLMQTKSNFAVLISMEKLQS